MRLKTFRHLWGISQAFEEAFSAIQQAGYDGVEFKAVKAAAYPGFMGLLEAHNFSFIAQVHTIGGTVDEHIASFKELTAVALPFNPVLINSQSGKDSWGPDEKQEFIERALVHEDEIGIPVAHEIHRGRITYNPWDTRELLLAFPSLRLCCDFSHWVCVCERLLQEEMPIIRLCADRCIHLHARVGYEQGPQVSDPRAPEYAEHLAAHEDWWDIIWQTQQQNKIGVSTLTPEFGPPAYQQTHPFSQAPLANLEEICDWMNNRQKERFQHLINAKQYVTVNRDHSGR